MDHAVHSVRNDRPGRSGALEPLSGGAAIVVVGLAALYAYQIREEWTDALLGLWLAASPWLLGFSGNMSFTASDVLAGAVVALLGGWMTFSQPARTA